ncbi:hypothetical protein CI105_02295 [Candidatus Izimaplasma bacterium ZiA1]|uniref:M81 family metallopeptidase n=1 Tax=Candidatus Izimoplasma sp. ZiA1 TaxID=2024899 RepID=UPI000BAA7691|nr:hypothetical protein CI105_02295 [Candidatus Izimaplasma bacterium ZiA1]
MSYNIVIGGIHIESTTFTSYISKSKDFRIRRSSDLLDAYPSLDEYRDEFNFIPLISARAIPGGVVSKEFFDKWFNEFTTLLKTATKANVIDGVLFDIHGAMSVEGMMDAEGYVAGEIRKIVGEKTIISTTMDLHGNVSDLLFDSTDLITCYRTAPHIDQDSTKKRAMKNLIDVLKGKYKSLYRAKVDIPILLPGEKTSTEVEPGKSLYKSLDNICNERSIIDASIWMGFPWADQPRCHSAVVLTGTNKELVKDATEKLAKKYWNIRKDFKFVGPVASTYDAVNIAISSKEKPFFISDTGDNPGAGGSNDINILLNEFMSINKFSKINKKILFASIFDKETIDVIYNSKTSLNVKVSLGCKVDKIFGKPMLIKVDVINKFSDDIAGKCAIINVDNIFIIVTENRFQYGTKKAFIKAGLKDFSDYDIIVVKMGYLEPDLSKAAKGWIMALTKGPVSQDLGNINYKYINRPLYPIDDFDFSLKLEAKIKKSI